VLSEMNGTIPRVAVTREEAAAALGVGLTTFKTKIAPELRVIRRGSLMIAAGVNAKALRTFMGHATVAITLDRYGHLMPGSEDEGAGLLDAYLEAERNRAAEAAIMAVA
jgi:integrase